MSNPRCCGAAPLKKRGTEKLPEIDFLAGVGGKPAVEGELGAVGFLLEEFLKPGVDRAVDAEVINRDRPGRIDAPDAIDELLVFIVGPRARR